MTLRVLEVDDGRHLAVVIDNCRDRLPAFRHLLGKSHRGIVGARHVDHRRHRRFHR